MSSVNPIQLTYKEILNLLPDAALLADSKYEIQWMNKSAHSLLDKVASYYGMSSSKEMIGQSMDVFHKQPSYNRAIMQNITEMHRVRITVAESVHADIIILPISHRDTTSTSSYLVLLSDVTMKAEEDEKQQQLIRQLSTPILKVWDHTMALPLIGTFDGERFDRMVVDVLEACMKDKYRFVILDVSKMDVSTTNESMFFFQKIIDSLRLIGAKTLLVGVTPEMAIHMVGLDRTVQIFSTTHDGLRHIISETN